MKELIIGSHVNMSSPKMLLGSVEQALSYEANTFMFYTGAPQNTKRKPISELRVEEAIELMKKNNINIDHLVVHAPYIINLANTTADYVFDLAKDFLGQEIERTAKIGAKLLVLHPGSHVGAGEEIGLSRIIDGLNEVLDKDDHDVTILLETMSGKGSELGYTFEQIRYIIDNVNKKERLGVCLDTCHIFDAGYDIVKDLDRVIAQFDEVVGLDLLKVVHVNDSKNTLGSSKDRHANIGEGYIGFGTLKKVVHHPLLQDKIFILETPWIDDKPPYKEEIKLLREGR